MRKSNPDWPVHDVENGNLVNLPTFIPLMMDLLYVPSFFGILADNAKHAIP